MTKKKIETPRLSPKTMTAEKVEKLFQREAPGLDKAVSDAQTAEEGLLGAIRKFGELFSNLDEQTYELYIKSHIKTLWPENNNTDKGKCKEAKIVIIWASRRAMPKGVKSLQGAYKAVNKECREKYCTKKTNIGGSKKKKKVTQPKLTPTLTFLEALKKNTGLNDELARQFINMTKSDRWQDELALWVVESFAEFERERAA